MVGGGVGGLTGAVGAGLSDPRRLLGSCPLADAPTVYHR